MNEGTLTSDIKERIRRARACLSEMGYTDSGCVVESWVEPGYTFNSAIFNQNDDRDVALLWTVSHTLGTPQGCWTCTLRYYRVPDYDCHPKCKEGNCPYPDEPKTPPRELLTARAYSRTNSTKEGEEQ